MEDDDNVKMKNEKKIRKAAARKVFNVIKGKCNMENLKHSSKDKVIAERSKDIHDEETVNKATKLSELNDLKKLYFSKEDYVTEKNMNDSGLYGSKLEVAQGLLLVRIDEFKKNIVNLDLEQDILNENNSKISNDKKDLNSEQFKNALVSFRKNVQDDDKELKLDESKMKVKTKIREYLEKNDDEEDSCNMIDTSNKESKNYNNIIFNNDNNIRNNLEKSIRLNLSNSEYRYSQVLDQYLRLSKNSNNIIAENNLPDLLGKIGEPANSESQFSFFINNIKNKNSEQIILDIIPILSSLVKENKELKEIINNLVLLEKDRRENEFLVAKNGGKGNEIKNKEVLVSQKMADLKNQGKYIEQSEWNKKPLIDKITERFHFSDFRQNPYIGSWRKLNQQEKIKFIKLKLQWREKRINELLEYDLEKNKDNIKKANNFSYYEWRDPNGYLLPTYDINDLSFYNNQLKEENEKIQNALKLASNKNLIRGFIIDDGELKLTKGKAWFNMSSVNLLGKKTKSSNNNKKRNNRKN